MSERVCVRERERVRVSFQEEMNRKIQTWMSQEDKVTDIDSDTVILKRRVSQSEPQRPILASFLLSALEL